jgi:hypothetical protein
MRSPTTPIFGVTGPVFVSRTSSMSSHHRPHLIPRSPIAHEPESPIEEVSSITVTDTLYTGLKPASSVLPLLYSRTARKRIAFGAEVDKRTLGQVLKAFGRILGGDGVEELELVLEEDGVSAEVSYLPSFIFSFLFFAYLRDRAI